MTVSHTFDFSITYTFRDEDADILEEMKRRYETGRVHDRVAGGAFLLNMDGRENTAPHRLVAYRLGLDLSSNKTVDHIDNNPANNVPDNLRAATKLEQSYNRRKYSHSASRYYGVCRQNTRHKTKNGIDKTYSYWVVRLGRPGEKRICKTNVKWTEEDAARYYDAIVIELGLDRPLNFPEEHQHEQDTKSIRKQLEPSISSRRPSAAFSVQPGLGD